MFCTEIVLLLSLSKILTEHFKAQPFGNALWLTKCLFSKQHRKFFAYIEHLYTKNSRVSQTNYFTSSAAYMCCLYEEK